MVKKQKEKNKTKMMMRTEEAVSLQPLQCLLWKWLGFLGAVFIIRMIIKICPLFERDVAVTQ